MRITDELRRWAWEECKSKYLEHVIAIADRIDQQHEECAGFCHRLEDAASKGEEVTLFGTDYVPLPNGADGVSIHVGDVAYDCNESPSEKFSVATMELCKWGWALIDDYGERNEPGQCRHYHEPTVEDLLREFAEKITDSQIPNVHPTYEEAIAEYADRLRLAGDE